ncbi:unnamed protein product [Vitrella brassicaformis CCMP3155]|uniref:NADP-dependent oxidoreductase domain-containing protein n=1 Tax=Vitrella brassicaformis (strain CCMP3155) TaxID=1169540 RepID=A0A0G4EWP7_VITBC|nr:unnamed protein product [Vitrella brassicaformis CCMP3155]|eukprot:CEM02840.1 unnamed protein product [Vitrella brassicaformis CCMP3155]
MLRKARRPHRTSAFAPLTPPASRRRPRRPLFVQQKTADTSLSEYPSSFPPPPPHWPNAITPFPKQPDKPREVGRDLWLAELIGRQDAANRWQTVGAVEHPDLVLGMRHRRLGGGRKRDESKGVAVSEVCLGTSHIGQEHLIDSGDAIEQLDVAVDEYGINFLDMGDNEPVPSRPQFKGKGHELIGKWIKDKGGAAFRERLVLSGRIATSETLVRQPHPPAQTRQDRKRPGPPMTRERIREAVDGFLGRLGTDYLDVVSLSAPDRYTPMTEEGEDTYCYGYEHDSLSMEATLDAFEELVKEGKVRHIAVSEETPWGLFKFASMAEQRGLPLVFSQHVYNIMNRNHVESSGLAEMAGTRQMNVPLVGYSPLAGGFLTAKYLDPERWNLKGPTFVPQEGTFPSFVEEWQDLQPEDWGFISYGPETGKLNRYKGWYEAYRASVFAHMHLGKLLKTARSHGYAMWQLALAWCYSRPFMGSTIITPRTLGQLRDSIRALNFPITPEIEQDVHEIFLRYRAPSGVGPYYGTELVDKPLAQSVYINWKETPIWSGGSYHPKLMSLPPTSVSRVRRERALNFHETYDQVLAMTGQYDDPTDENKANMRLWREMLEEGRPGEFFAVKDAKLFGWDTKTPDYFNWRNLTREERIEQNTDHFEIIWTGGQVKKVNATWDRSYVYTDANVRDIYRDEINKWQDFSQYLHKFAPPTAGAPVFNELDPDLIIKKLDEKWGIDLYDTEMLERLRESNGLSAEEWETFAHWDTTLNKRHQILDDNVFFGEEH